MTHATPPSPRKLIFGLDQPWVIECLLWIELIKLSAIGLWPHAYAGELTERSRLAFYATMLVSLLALGLLVRNAHRVTWRQPWVITAAAFMGFATAHAALLDNAKLGTLLAVLGYWEGFATIALSMSILGTDRLLKILAAASAGFVGINLAALAMPERSFMVGEFAGRFRGLMVHRNDLAQVATIAAFVLITCKGHLGPALRGLALLGAVLLIGLAGSVQGILLMSGGIAIYFGLRSARHLRHPMLAVTTLFALALGGIAWWSFGSLDEFLRLFGRDSTFTGRDRIWRLALYLLERMPWQGYGFGAFSSQLISPTLLGSFELGTLFGTTHNSYLEAFLDFGWIGGGLFTAAVLAGSSTILFPLRRGTHQLHALAPMILLTCLVGGLTATEKLFAPQFGWFSFMLACTLASHLRPNRT